MGATAFQRMRRVQALKQELIDLGIEFDENTGEEELRKLLPVAEVEAVEGEEEFIPEPETEGELVDLNGVGEELTEETIKAELVAKARELGIKHAGSMSIETLQEKIAELEGEKE